MKVWLVLGQSFLEERTVPLTSNFNANWAIKGTGDFNRDGNTDIVWYHEPSRQVSVWRLNNTANNLTVIDTPLVPLPNAIPDGWSLRGTGDFNEDGNSDLVWHHTGGTVSYWLMNGINVTSTPTVSLTSPASAGWLLVGAANFNSGAKSDLLWYHPASGSLSVWLVSGANGTNVSSTPLIGNSATPGGGGWLPVTR